MFLPFLSLAVSGSPHFMHDGLTPKQALQESRVEAAGFLQANLRMSLTLLVLVRKVTKPGSDQGKGNQISHPLMGSQQAPSGGTEGMVGAIFGDRLPQ